MRTIVNARGRRDLPPARPVAAPHATTFRFTRVWSTANIYYGATSGLAAGVRRRIVFAPPPRTTLPDELSLAAAWQVDGGLFAFLGSDPSTDAALLRSLDNYLDLAGNADVGVAWIENPGAPLASWRAMPLHLTARYAGGATLAADAAIALRNYALTFAKGCGLALDADNTRFAISGTVAVVADTDAVHVLPIVRGPVTADVADTGRLGCTLALRAAAEPADADALDIACRFYQPNGSGIASLRFPLFDPAVAAFGT